MKKIKLIRLMLLVAVSVGLGSCKGTWLMYDTDQKDRLYFTEKGVTSMQYVLGQDASFALIADQQIEVVVPVYLMGQVSDQERTFEVEIVRDTLTSVVSGEITRPVENAVAGEDFVIGKMSVPARAVEGRAYFTIKRTDKILTKTASILFQIKSTDQFDGLPGNLYRILISDGEPVCPTWWIYGKNPDGSYITWYQFLGKYTTVKHRKLLEFYHGIEQQNPELYKALVEQFGVNIDKKQPDDDGNLTVDLTLNFMLNKKWPYKIAWVRYVLCPMFDYFKANYPDDEKYTTSSVNWPAGGWRDPAYNY